MEQGGRRCLGRGCGEGLAGEKVLPCPGASQGQAGHGFGGLSPPQHGRITARFCRAMLAAGRAERTGTGDAGTERGDTGSSRARTSPRPGMLCPSSPSTHLRSPSRGETEARPGAGEGPELGAAGRSRAGNERWLCEQQPPAGPARPSSPLPSPPRPSPPLARPTLPRGRGDPGRAVPGQGRPRAPSLCRCRCGSGSFGTAGRAAQRNPSWAFVVFLGEKPDFSPSKQKDSGDEGKPLHPLPTVLLLRPGGRWGHRRALGTPESAGDTGERWGPRRIGAGL